MKSNIKFTFYITQFYILLLFMGFIVRNHVYFLLFYLFLMGTAVAQWLRCCATNRKVAGLVPPGVIGFFH